LYSKAEYKAKKALEGKMGENVKIDERDLKAAVFLEALGGKNNIKDVTNCATRLRVTVIDDALVKSVSTFTKAGAHGLVKNGHAVQVIVGLSVPQIRERFEALLQDKMAEDVISGTEKSTMLKAFVSGKVIPISQVPDEMFSQKMMGDGIAVYPQTEFVTAPADGEITMVMEGSGHAVGMRLASGVELLIHIGLDTVKMEGRGFQVRVKAGQKVKAGEELVKFDKNLIEQEGYSSLVILAVTNSTEYPFMKLSTGMTAKVNETVIATF